MTAEDRAEGAPLLKDILGKAALETIALALAAHSAKFDSAVFRNATDEGFAALSIMERVRSIAGAIHSALPLAFPDAVAVVCAAAPGLTHGFQAMPLSEFVSAYGLDDYALAMDALAQLTRFGSSEFAVRPFIDRYPERSLATMLGWAASADEHVRRLASEGCRPRLPWARRVSLLTKEPATGWPILDRLKTDPSPYVRKSVANHLNDIAKDRPDWLVSRLAQWDQSDPHTRWIVRHGLRTLVKKGDQHALALVGATRDLALHVGRFSVSPDAVRLGQSIRLEVELSSTAASSQRLVVDYRVHLVRASGRTSAKVFKLRTFDLEPGATVRLATDLAIKPLSTRSYYPGRHVVDLTINGATLAVGAFELVGAPGAIPDHETNARDSESWPAALQ